MTGDNPIPAPTKDEKQLDPAMLAAGSRCVLKMMTEQLESGELTQEAFISSMASRDDMETANALIRPLAVMLAAEIAQRVAIEAAMDYKQLDRLSMEALASVETLTSMLEILDNVRDEQGFEGNDGGFGHPHLTAMIFSMQTVAAKANDIIIEMQERYIEPMKAVAA